MPTTGVVGTDGIEPVYEPDARWTVWALHQIFTGQIGAGRYVPKVRDIVVDMDTEEWYKVASIDATTLIARLVPFNTLAQNQTINAIDAFLGVGPGTISDTFILKYNKNVLPHTLTVDQRIYIRGSRSESVKIFRGNNIDGTTQVISQVYNQNNEITGNTVMLELADIDGQNIATKSVPTCYTTEELTQDEIVTMVAYSDDGVEVARAQLLVKITSFTPTADASTKYVVSISLESPFLSSADPSTLQFPLNVPLSGLSLIGVVHYSNGATLRMSVDGTRFAILGFNGFVASIPGRSIPLILTYQLSASEVAYGVSTTIDRKITRDYTAITTNLDGQYTPKLYVYPVWVDAVNGYRLEWWLYDLDRDLSILATPYVTVNSNSAAFNPIGYGYKQNIGVSVNLKSVNVSSKDLNHVQTVDIVLRQPATTRSSNWAIGYDSGQEILYGDNVHAVTTFVNANLYQVDVTCGETVLANWLEKLYRLVKPLYNPGTETRAPDPTHFAIATRDNEVVYPINQWNQVLSAGFSIPDNSTLYVKFIIRTADNDIQLAISGLPVWQS